MPSTVRLRPRSRHCKRCSTIQKIIAPFDGVITGRFADPGALIRAGGGDFGVDETSGLISPGATEGAGGHREGGGPILTLADIDKLRVYIYVPEASYPFIHHGTPASLHFDEFPDRVFKGAVARYASSLDLATRTMLTEVDIDNPKRLVYPRSYAHVPSNWSAIRDALSVPASAIQGSGDSARLLVVTRRPSRRSAGEEPESTTALSRDNFGPVVKFVRSRDLQQHSYPGTAGGVSGPE